MIEVPASKNVLKDFPTKLLTSSYNERKFLFSSLEVSSLEEKDGLSEVAAKEIAKLLPLTLPRYVHGWSRTLIENFLNKSPDRLSPSLFRGLLSGLRDYYKNATDSVATRSNAKIALSALKWITILFRRLPVVEDDEIKQFLELNRILATLIVGGNCSKTRFYSKKILNQQWKGGGPACSALVKQLMTEPISKSMAYEVFFFECLLVHEEDVSHVKALIIDGAIKNVIASKTRANLIFVENLREVLRQISREEFEKHFLSAILKSLLRNPEIVMGTVATILKHLVIDLGSYIEEFTKHLKTNLHAKDDGIREDTVSAVGYLVKNCKESAKIEHLLDAIFAVFNGKEGKISVISQKLSLLEAAGKIKENSLDTSSLQQLASLSIDHFIKVLESESHEHVLISGLDNILLWCDKCSLEISSKLINWLPKGMNLKTTTANVRLSYLLCMYQVLTLQKEKTLEFLPSLTQCLDNLSKQSGQISAVYEGVIVSGCIFQYPEHLNDVKKYLNAASSTLAQDRCLQPMTYHVLLPLIYLASEMVISHSDVSVNWFKILSVGLLNEDKRVRQYSLTACQKIQSGLQGKEFTKTLMHELTTLIFHSNSSSASKESNWGISWKIVKESLKIFRSPSDEFGKELLFPCHSYEIQKESFQSWSQLMNSNTKKWVEDNGNNIVNFIKEKMADPHFHQAISRISKTMVKIAPDTWKTETLLWMETIILRNNISVTDYEYNVFKTPKGELYDSSIISSSNDTGAANIKRENKAYSYKEQMEEIALRKEIEEKKRKEGKFTSPKLTPKQQEAFNAQLKVESQVREKVEKIINDIIPFDVVFASAIDSYPEAFETEVGPIFKLLFASLKNKILLEKAKRVLFFFRHAFSYLRTNDSLAQIAANILYNIQCPNPQIVEKDLKLCLEKFIDNLHSITDGGKIFSPPTFHFCFPVIKKALTSSIDDGCFHKGLEIISRHCSIRGPLTSIMSPKYLPRTEILKVLINLISNLSGRSQQSVICVIIDVAESASGKSGCDTISEEEVEILLGALQCEVAPVRDASLRCLKIMLNDSFKMYTKFNFLRRILIARFDESEEHTVAANEIWQKIDLSVQPEMAFDLISDIKHPNHCIRQASSSAIAFLFEKDVSNVSEILKILLDVYSVNLNMTPPVKDNLGRVISESIDHWEARSGVALSINKISPFFDSSMVRSVISFLVPQGLSDRNDTVRKYMLDAAVTTIDLHGKDSSNELLPVFEDFMENAPASGVYDSVRQSVVVLMGSLARHLDPDSPKVKTILRQLILALNTPSQQVQEAVANCLPPLVPSIKSEAPSIINTLINTLIGSDISYGDRKGAAYGIAGIVKGLGILSLKQCDVMSKLSEAIANKKNPTHREGALFAFEMLCTMLGRLFEPYIVHILPHLLLCFGDPIDHVRLAADDTTKAVMKKLSAHGVKLVLPSLLDALEKDQWRTKTGSIELLGAMAYCAPKQLSSCLPSIVPKLIAILGDSHHKVQNAGAQALRQIGSVIKNPEIQAIVPVLLKALQDPAKKTGHCLQILLETKFVHFIDAPSLALIMPVVQRAFQDRSTETRKMAAQIIGNMYSLTDQKDLSPYLPGIIPGLKASLLDPVPEVRAVSARALGAMVKGIGESSFEELLPWLMSTLTSESSSVDRSGAAQGLAEVVGGLGVEKMDALMPDIIKTTERMDIAPHVKDGYIMMFIYMPLVFPDEFRQYIGKIISPILRALADENEFVRETAYKSGQRLVVTYAESAIELLLPELEKGLFEDNWRIRHSSIQLLGDLLYKISGVSGKMSTETSGEDDNFGTEQSQKVIVETLGEERRNRVLAGLYMGRSDVALMVRQASLHVWKVIVSNTPKTLREILPTLFNLLLGCLASSSFDKRQVAARTLGDLVKKLGERVLPEIIPILEEGLKSNQPEKRQGVCVGLSEIMASTSREMVLTFVDSLVPTVKKALCDDLSEVREAAAKTFDSLHNTVGSRALDDILPYMLKQLDDEDRHENTLDGLRQVIMIKSRAVLPYLIPKLISPPVNSKALASLAPVAGEALHRHLPRILPSLIASLSKALSTPDEGSELSYVQSVILSVKDDQDDSGVSYIMEELISSCKSDDMNLKKSSVMLLNSFCSQTKTSYLQYVPQLIRILILLFTESDNIVLVEAWNTLNSITKGLDNAELMDLVPDVRQALRFALMDNEGKDLLAGFCLPKGITPILPIFRESILNGSPELKEQAAVGLGEVIKVTSPESLKPSVVHITGPLIRILGDRFAPSVKVAVLETLATLLSRAGVMLKPFFPQLQTTFLKALNDTTRSVRLKAGLALSYLITIHVRPDPLFNEILVGIKNADDASFRDTYLQALRGCITPDGGEKMTPAIRKQVLTVLLGFLQHPEETSRVVGSGCIGALCKWMTPEELTSTLDGNILTNSPSMDEAIRHGKSCALFVALKETSEKVFEGVRKPVINSVVQGYLSSDSIQVVRNGIKSIGYIFQHHFKREEEVPSELILPFCKCMNHASNDVKRLVAVMGNHLAKMNYASILPSNFLKPLIPMLVNGTKEKNTAVKSSSEFALISLLHLREAKDYQKCLEVLDAGGAREALQDVVSKVLQKMANQPDGDEEVVDDTILV